MQAIVPVAGLGTRMLPISQAVPKELLPLGPKPALQWVAEELAESGVKRIVLVTSESKGNIGRMFQTDPTVEQAVAARPQLRSLLWSHGPWRRVDIETAIQVQQNGLGHAVLCGRESLTPGPFVVALGDCVLGTLGKTETVRRMIELFESNKADAVIAFQPVRPELVSRYGIARPGETLKLHQTDRQAFRLLELIEKPDVESAPSQFAVAGRYLFSDRIFEFLDSVQPDAKCEIQLTTAIDQLIRSGGRAFGITLADGEQRFDLGNYKSWAAAFMEFACADDPELFQAIAKPENQA